MDTCLRRYLRGGLIFLGYLAGTRPVTLKTAKYETALLIAQQGRQNYT